MPKPLITAARAALLILEDLASRIVRDGVPIKTAARELREAIEDEEKRLRIVERKGAAA